MPNPPEPNMGEYCVTTNNGKIQLFHATCNGPTPLVAQWWMRNCIVWMPQILEYINTHHEMHRGGQ